MADASESFFVADFVRFETAATFRLESGTRDSIKKTHVNTSSYVTQHSVAHTYGISRTLARDDTY